MAKVPIPKSSLAEAGTIVASQRSQYIAQSRRHFAVNRAKPPGTFLRIVSPRNPHMNRSTMHTVASHERIRRADLEKLAFIAPEWRASSMMNLSRLESSPLTNSVELLQNSLPPPSQSSEKEGELQQQQKGRAADGDTCNMLARAAVLRRVLSEDVLLDEVPTQSSTQESSRMNSAASFAPLAASVCLGIREEESNGSLMSSKTQRQTKRGSAKKSKAPSAHGRHAGGDSDGIASMSDHVIHSLVSQVISSSLSLNNHSYWDADIGWDTAVSLAAALAPEDPLAVHIMERAVQSGCWQTGTSETRTDSNRGLPPELERCALRAVREHPSLAPAVWMALSKYLKHMCASEATDHRIALHMPGMLLDATVALFCDDSASCVLGHANGGAVAVCDTSHIPSVNEGIPSNDPMCAVSHVFRTGSMEVHRGQWVGKTDSIPTTGIRHFSDVWSRLVNELVEYALAVFNTAVDLLEGPLSTSKECKTNMRAVRQSTERILRSFGRMIGSLRKRSCLGAVAELHSRLVVLGEGAAAADLAELSAVHSEAAGQRQVFEPRLPLHCPRVRQCTMIDAYTLLTLGHLADTAADLNDSTVGYGRNLLQHMAWLLSSLSRSQVSNGSETGDAAVVSQQDRALMTRMEESLRVATKLLLRSGDLSSIAALYAACPEMGPCWEVGVALATTENYTDAMRVYAGFLAATRVAFASNGLPAYVRERLFETVASGVHVELRRAWTDFQAAALQSVEVSNALEEDAAVHAVVESIVELYQVVRQWQSAIHPAVVFREIIQAFTTFSDMTAEETLESDARARASSSSSDTFDNIPKLHIGTEDTIVHSPSQGFSGSKKKEMHRFLFLAAAGCIQRVCTLHARDGLLLKTVKSLLQLYVDAAAKCDSAPIHEDVEGSTKLGKQSPLIDVLYTFFISVHESVPSVPVLRTTLICILEHGEPRDASTFLLREMRRAKDSTSALSSLQEMPLIALEGLQHACGCAREAQSVCSAQDTHVESDTQLIAGCIALVTEALQLREAADQARDPWKCFFCHMWNTKHSKACKVCGALDMAVWMCPKCNTFSSTTSDACEVCSFKRTPTKSNEEPAGGRKEDTELIIPLRRWRCDTCASENDAMLPFYCKSCGHMRSEVKPIVDKTAFHCSGCDHYNAQGSLRPWCSACGKLKPSVAESAGRQAVVWRCVECQQWNPWLTVRCLSCEDGVKPSSATRTEVAPWFQWHCGACTESNAAWMRTCRSCGRNKAEELDGEVAEVRERPSVKSIDQTQSSHLSPKAVPAMTDSQSHDKQASSTVCTNCCSPVAAESPICLTCFTVQRRTHTPSMQTQSLGVSEECMLWVCLRNNCLEMNLSAGDALSSEVRCTRCGQPQGLLTSITYQSNPLAYVKSTQNAEGIQTPVAESRLPSQGALARASSPPVNAPAALQLPLPITSTTCETCGVPLDPRNVSNLCRHCLSFSPSTVPHVALRILLPVAQRTLERAQCGSLAPTDAVSLLRSIVRVFRTSEESALPWQGRDLENGMLCGLSQRYPALPSGAVHSSIQSIAEMIRTCCGISQDVCSQHRSSTMTVGSSSSVAHSPLSRAWLCVALDLVDLVNASTDFDEIGFETLATLCTSIRPHQREDVYRETRWTFLRDMKLSREAIVNGVACVHCLAPVEGASNTCRACGTRLRRQQQQQQGCALNS